MKKLLSLLLVLAFVLPTQSLVYALPQPEKSDIVTTLSKRPQDKVVSTEELFITLIDIAGQGEGIPSTYRFIEVKSDKIAKGTRLHRAYQKAIYLDLIPNDGSTINL